MIYNGSYCFSDMQSPLLIIVVGHMVLRVIIAFAEAMLIEIPRRKIEEQIFKWKCINQPDVKIRNIFYQGELVKNEP